MKLGSKRPGTSTTFVDSVADEALLQFSWDGSGLLSLAFHIYDAGGQLIADSGGVSSVGPVSIVGPDGEVLLDIPSDSDEHIRYRLYNQTGNLLTVSDGIRTQIYSCLRMDSKRSW